MVDTLEKPKGKSQTQVTRLLSNDQLTRLGQMRLQPNRRLTSRMRGENKASASGTSIEFRDYRDYSSGDDMRFVDWNIFARLHRPYIKLYHEEEQMNIVLLIDASQSMCYENKLQTALSLAAASSVMGLMAVERLSLYVFNQKGNEATRLRPRRGRAAMREVFGFLESIKGGGDMPLEDGIDAMLRVHRGRGMVVLLSDFLTHRDLRKSFNALHSVGLEPVGVQILAPQEIDPELATDLRLVDSETTETLDITAGGDLLRIYHEYRIGLEREIESFCRQRGGRFMTVNSQHTIDTIMFEEMKRKGWIR